MYIVYIIKSKEGYKYTGMTEDLELRIKQHNEKALSFWTKRGTQWELIYKEEFYGRTEALKRCHPLNIPLFTDVYPQFKDKDGKILPSF